MKAIIATLIFVVAFALLIALNGIVFEKLGPGWLVIMDSILVVLGAIWLSTHRRPSA
jgi:ABC-type polysaccharide/polyol phosphate export permease